MNRTSVTRPLIPVVSVLLLSGTAPAWSSDPGDFDFFGTLPEHVDIEAGSLTTREGGKVLLLENGVRLTGEDLDVRAEWAEIRLEDDRVVLEGAVKVIEGTSVLLCDRLELDRRTSAALIHRAVILVKEDLSGNQLRRCRTASGLVRSGFNALTLRGSEMERREGRYRVEDARFTACDCDDGAPSWEIRAARADILPSERAWLLWPVLYLKGLPVFILPVAYLPLSNRRTGFLFPQFNYSGRDGFVLSESFFVAMGPSVDATLSVDWFEERGIRKRLEFRARPTRNASIQARVAHIDDDKTREDAARSSLHDRLSAELDAWVRGPGGSSARTAVRVYSDSDINRDFMSEMAGRAADEAPSALVADLRGDHVLGMLDMTYRQDLRFGAVDLFGPQAHDTIHRLGAFSFHLAPTRIVPGVPLEIAGLAEVANLSSLSAKWRDWGPDGTPSRREPRYAGADDRDRGADDGAGGEENGLLDDGELRRALRMLFEPGVRLPLRFGRHLWMAAGVRHRQLAYLPHGPSPVEGPDPVRATTRGITFAELSLGTELSRTFGPESGVGHVIAPRLGVAGAWRGLESPGPHPYLDWRDRLIGDAFQLVAGVETGLHRRLQDGTFERWMALGLLQAVDLRGGRVGQGTAELSLNVPPATLRVRAGLDWHTTDLAELDASAGWRDRRGDSVRITYLLLPSREDAAGRPLPLSERTQREDDLLFGMPPSMIRALGETVHVLEGQAFVPVAWGLGVNAGASLDLREEKLAWYGGGIRYQSECRCWGFSVTVRMLRGQDFPDIFFLLDLAYLGAAGVGTNTRF